MSTRRWIAIGCVGFVLVFVGRKIEWWFHEESGRYMAGTLVGGKLANAKPDEARAFASEVCGEPVAFDRVDKTAYWNAMPELQVSRHFFLYGLYRNAIWVALGFRGKFCLARFEIAMRKHDCAWPFPYCNRWSWESLDEVRLIDRIQRPKAPVGVNAILPGECVTGRLEAGETAKFQVEVPSFGQELTISAFGDNQRPQELEVGIRKDGGPQEDFTGRLYVDKMAGGIYLIWLRAPASDFKNYVVETYWSGTDANCREPAGWRDTDWTDHAMEPAKP